MPGNLSEDAEGSEPVPKGEGGLLPDFLKGFSFCDPGTGNFSKLINLLLL